MEIGTAQVLREYDQSRETQKELLLGFWETSEGPDKFKFQTIRCRKPQKAEVNIDLPPQENKSGDCEKKYPYNFKEIKAILVEKIDPINDRDRFKTLKICSLITLNGYVIYP